MATFRRHLAVALLVFAVATVGALVSFFYVGKTYEATVRLVRVVPMLTGASDKDDDVIRQAQALLTDDDVLTVEQRFHLYPVWLQSLVRKWVIDGVRSKLSFRAVGDGGSSSKQLSVSFTDRSSNLAREVINAIAVDISRRPASADESMFVPSPVPELRQSRSPDNTSMQGKSAAARAVLTRHIQILQHNLENARQREMILQSSLEKTANDWAHVRRELVSRTSVEVSPGTVSILNQQRAKLEPQIISLQRELEANRSQQRKWKGELEIATLALDSHDISSPTQPMPDNTSLRGEPVPSVVSFNLAEDTSVKISEAVPSLQRVLPSSLGLGFAVLLATMFVLSRRDGVVTRFTDLSRELPASIVYLGDIPRIKL